MIRPSAVAGTFYPADPRELQETVDHFIAQAKDVEIENLKGVIAPHAGYVFSGKTAGHAYKLLSKLPKKEWHVFILAPAHQAFVEISVGNFDSYETPLGNVKVNKHICGELLNQTGFEFIEAAHMSEHAIEVQLPFLQRSLVQHQFSLAERKVPKKANASGYSENLTRQNKIGAALENFKIIPILCGSIDPETLANALKPFWGQESNLFVVSSDLSHYLPLTEANQIDKTTIDNILAKKSKKEIDACGKVPIKAAVQLASKVELLNYSTSAEASGDTSGVVGYASFALS